MHRTPAFHIRFSMRSLPWLLLPLLFGTVGLSTSTAEDWLRFRGPNGSGISTSEVPTKFGEETNMKWKAELPGRGVSSPIVVGDKVFVTCYSGYGTGDGGELADLKRHLVCLARTTGKVAWTATEQAAMPEDPYTGMGVPAHGYASHTPTSDGERVYAFFGKSGVFAYDMEGKKLWHKNVGQESGARRWGSSSSPILTDGLLVVLASDESETLFGLDPETGEERWKESAHGFADIWGTPVIAEGAKGSEIVLAVPGETWGLNPKSGKLRWIAPGNGGGSHSVVVSDGFAYSIGGSRNGSAALAVKLGGRGEIEEAAWEARSTSRFATPLVYDDRVYSVSGDFLVCYDAKTGEQLFKNRLPAKLSNRAGGGRFGSQSYASPILANGNIYISEVGGTIYVVEAAPEFKPVATNDMTFDSSGFNGSPAVSDGDLFLRSNTHLYCIGE